MTTRVSGIAALISVRTSKPLPGVPSRASLRMITWETHSDVVVMTETRVAFATDNFRSRLNASAIKFPVSGVLSATITFNVLLSVSTPALRVMSVTPK